MNALILVAHGSHRSASNREVEQLGDALRAQSGGRFARVSVAFLEFATPSIAEAIEEVVAAGAREVTLLPYFLTAGNHVVRDVPAALEAGRRRHPNVAFRLTAYAGSAKQIPALLLDVVHASEGA